MTPTYSRTVHHQLLLSALSKVILPVIVERRGRVVSVRLYGGKVSTVDAVHLVGSLWHRRLRRHGNWLTGQRWQQRVHVRMIVRLNRHHSHDQHDRRHVSLAP